MPVAPFGSLDAARPIAGPMTIRRNCLAPRPGACCAVRSCTSPVDAGRGAASVYVLGNLTSWNRLVEMEDVRVTVAASRPDGRPSRRPPVASVAICAYTTHRWDDL